MRFKRERRRTAQEAHALAYYSFGGQCYHRLAEHAEGKRTRTHCGHRLIHIHESPSRIWRGAPPPVALYRACKVCYPEAG